MSNVSDAQKALAGTLLNDRGGESMLNSLFDVYVAYQTPSGGAAGDLINTNIFRNTLGVNLRLEEALVIPDAALTAADATKITLTIFQGVAGAVTTAAAAANTATVGSGGTGNWVADTPVALTLSATAANRVVADGSIVCFDKAITSTGTVLPAGCVQLKFRRV